jgi:hypothetical protein
MSDMYALLHPEVGVLAAELHGTVALQMVRTALLHARHKRHAHFGEHVAARLPHQVVHLAAHHLFLYVRVVLQHVDAGQQRHRAHGELGLSGPAGATANEAVLVVAGVGEVFSRSQRVRGARLAQGDGRHRTRVPQLHRLGRIAKVSASATRMPPAPVMSYIAAAT